MASGKSVGLPQKEVATRDRFFSESSAIKLTLAEGKSEIISEVEAKAAGNIKLSEIDIPNTIIEGKNAGTETIPASAL
jgi:hypothetical protein